MTEKNNKEPDSADVLLHLVKEMKRTGAADIHFTANNIQHTKNLTGVISAYDNQKPDHMVLDELVAWCVEQGYQDVLNKIASLAGDMSWNADNAVRPKLLFKHDENDEK